MKTKKIIGGVISALAFIMPNIALAGEGWSISQIQNFGLPSGNVQAIIVGILSWLLGMLGIIGVIGFAISGIMYLVSAGDDDAIKRAKKGMTASIIGILVGLAGVVAIQAMENILRARIF